MADRDRRYYGYSEYERIQKNIMKKKRWMQAHSDKTENCAKKQLAIDVLIERLLVITLT